MNNEEKQDALLSAIKENNTDKVRGILTYIDDIDFINDEKNTALIVAAQIKEIRYEIVKLLISAGADVNKHIEGRACTTLFYAAKNGRADIAELLLKKNADIEAKDSYGRTPLCISARWDHEKVITLLLDNKANIEATSSDNESVLDQAIYSGNLNRIKQLIDFGVNIEFDNKEKINPQSLAKNRLDELLDYAIKNNFVEVSQWLIDQGADVHDTNLDFFESKLAELNLLLKAEFDLLRRAQLTFDKIPLVISLIKMLLCNGINIKKAYFWFAEDKYILNTAKLVDFLFNSPDEQITMLEKIDLEIFISRFNFHLKHYEDEFNIFNKIISNFLAIYNHHSKKDNINIDNQIFAKTVDIIIHNCILYIKENGFDLEDLIVNLNIDNHTPALMKDKAIKILLQAQDDFNLKCASIFSLSLKNIYKDVATILAIPITTIAEGYIEANNDEYSCEITDSIKNLFKFYNENSDLKIEYLINYFTQNIDEDENDFKANVTAANIQIFQKYMALIIEECPINHIFDLLDLALPIDFINLVDDYFGDKNDDHDIVTILTLVEKSETELSGENYESSSSNLDII